MLMKQNGIEETLSGRLPWRDTYFLHHLSIMQHMQLYLVHLFLLKFANAKALY